MTFGLWRHARAPTFTEYLVMLQKSKMHKESQGSSPTFHQGWSNYGCSSELPMIQRRLAEPFFLRGVHVLMPFALRRVHVLMPFVVRKSAFRLLSKVQKGLTPSDRCCVLR